MNFNNQKDKNRIKKPRTPEIKNMNNKNSKGFIKDNITKYKNAKRPGMHLIIYFKIKNFRN